MKYLVPLFSLFFLFSCSGVEPISEYNPNTDFKTFATFTICESTTEVPEKYQEYDNAQSRAVIKKILVEQMQSFGYVYDDVSPDLLVSYEIKFEDMLLQYTQCRSRDEYQVWDECKIVDLPFTEGTMVLTIIENTFSEMVWIGSMKDAWIKSEEKRFEKQMKVFVKYLFDEFPVFKPLQ